jgi:phospholipid/cholesterol/gamma-HCH transport system substrate-binding protein
VQPSSKRDFVVGLFVAAGLACIAYLTFQVGGLAYTGPTGLRLSATFDEVGGLSVRAPVVVAGVKVGQVTRITLDSGLRAEVEMDLDPDLRLPIDSAVAIRTSGLLGDQFLSLEPGAEDALLESGDAISFAENAINLESLLGTFIHGSVQESNP